MPGHWGMGHSPSLRLLPRVRVVALRWPLPALAAWAAGWMAMALLQRTGALPPVLAVAAGLLVAAAPASLVANFWRRAIVAGGFPV